MNEKDKQFINGLRAAVRTMGRNHIAPGQYFDGATPACIVGWAAYHAWGIRLNEHTMADAHLSALGCSRAVALAARVAQTVQDGRSPWHEAEEQFDLALEMYAEQPHIVDVPCPCGCNAIASIEVYSLIARVAHAHQAGRRAQIKAELGQQDHALVA